MKDMDLGLKGLRVVVTAGAGGIGLEIVNAFLEEGARVHICDVAEGRIAETVGQSPNLSGSVCDVSDRQAVSSLFSEAIAKLGGIDCLVNNAGIAGPTGRVDEIQPDEWDKTLSVNCTGQFNCVRMAVPHLLKSSNPSIINVSSAAGKFGFQYRSPYAASKWAVIGLTKSLSMELGQFGVRVNAVLPGIVAGERQDAVLMQKAVAKGITLDEMKKVALAQVSIKEMISPCQIADAILCLSSLRFKTVSGQILSIDGDLQALS
jgi:NAD(P)-dependent dehydrogenase (short-subunit alcohol dehydrogenase family)